MKNNKANGAGKQQREKILVLEKIEDKEFYNQNRYNKYKAIKTKK